MHRFIVSFAGLLAGALLLVPLYASALGTSFGGKILAITPCMSLSGPAVWIKILPAGLFPITYIWTPLTIGLPPVHVAQQILGVADIPYGCVVGKVPFVGQRIQIDGVSI